MIDGGVVCGLTFLQNNLDEVSVLQSSLCSVWSVCAARHSGFIPLNNHQPPYCSRLFKLQTRHFLALVTLHTNILQAVTGEQIYFLWSWIFLLNLNLVKCSASSPPRENNKKVLTSNVEILINVTTVKWARLCLVNWLTFSWQSDTPSSPSLTSSWPSQAPEGRNQTIFCD